MPNTTRGIVAMTDALKCFLLTGLLASIGALCAYVDKQRERIRISAYVAQHVCVEGRSGLCYEPRMQLTSAKNA